MRIAWRFGAADALKFDLRSEASPLAHPVAWPELPARGSARVPSSLPWQPQRPEVDQAARADTHILLPDQRPRTADPGRVTILLCTHNGAPFLETQLQSLSAQTHANWRLVVSDDGSADGTRQILEHYSIQRPQSQVDIRHRAQALGAIANFMSLLCDGDIVGDFFACCDQDDVWWQDKLERALQWLHTVPEHVPAVYFSRTRNVDASGNTIGCSPLFRRPPSFRNALVQSIGGGNTMVFNRAAQALLVAAGPVDVASHDWWTYLLVSGAGGSVHYDPNPSLDYRQHGANQIGANQGLRARLKRARMVAGGQLAVWFDRHTTALVQCAHLLTDENRQLLGEFGAMRSGSIAERIAAWSRLRPYRQSFMAQSLLFVALLANKV